MKTYYVCEDYYGKPNYDKTNCYFINPRFIVRAYKKEEEVPKFGDEFEYVKVTFYMGEYFNGHEMIKFHFLDKADWKDFVGLKE